MRVMPPKLVSNYSCKSGEKVEFDLLHFRDSNDFVLCIDGFTSFRALKKKKRCRRHSSYSFEAYLKKNCA